MRLTDLHPHWVGLAPGHALGITFLCPHCKAIRIGILFDVPIGGHLIESIIGRSVTAKLTQESNMKMWHRTGETFETLKLTPSIDTSEHGHWHGTITNGEVT